jgi:hypothetical protein
MLQKLSWEQNTFAPKEDDNELSLFRGPEEIRRGKLNKFLREINKV